MFDVHCMLWGNKMKSDDQSKTLFCYYWIERKKKYVENYVFLIFMNEIVKLNWIEWNGVDDAVLGLWARRDEMGDDQSNGEIRNGQWVSPRVIYVKVFLPIPFTLSWMLWLWLWWCMVWLAVSLTVYNSIRFWFGHSRRCTHLYAILISRCGPLFY